MRLLSKRISESYQNRPRLVGDGPSWSTSNHAIERQPFRWDTNRFYSRLGLTPEASRVEIARRFIEVGGHGSSATTTATTLLLNRGNRRFYDALMIGTFWGGDEGLRHHLIDPDDTTLVSATETSGWSVYAEPGVSDAEVESFPPEWRSLMAAAFWRYGEVITFSLGVTKGEAKVDIIGYQLVIFLPLAEVPSEVYASAVAQQVLAMLNSSHSTPLHSTA